MKAPEARNLISPLAENEGKRKIEQMENEMKRGN